MQAEKENAALCRSVFREATEADIAKAFTRKWIEMVNRLERARQG